jgi:hypothetical protein
MVSHMEVTLDPAAAYRLAYGRKLMVLAHLKHDVPGRDEFCRIRTVETVSPGLWLSVTFLDGSIQRFRPEKIRAATPDEEHMASQLQAEGM